MPWHNSRGPKGSRRYNVKAVKLFSSLTLLKAATKGQKLSTAQHAIYPSEALTMHHPYFVVTLEGFTKHFMENIDRTIQSICAPQENFGHHGFFRHGELQDQRSILYHIIFKILNREKCKLLSLQQNLRTVSVLLVSAFYWVRALVSNQALPTLLADTFQDLRQRWFPVQLTINIKSYLIWRCQEGCFSPL